jgi:sporadic carbohydrate cluster 2OG-Fe(II) oxygenase
MENQFFTKNEDVMATSFLENGYLIQPVENLEGLQKIQNFIASSASNMLGVGYIDSKEFLNNIHLYINPKELNEFRIKIIHALNQEVWFRLAYYNMAKSTLQTIVGNELAMQLRINLSIQMPRDESSLLPIHADVWSGDSPYEVVVWIPLVDCFGTKAMYILPPKESQHLHENFLQTSSARLYEKVKDDIRWINIKAGEILIFNQNLPHGNITNLELETRWSMNCRFKSIFSPYGDKKIGL